MTPAKAEFVTVAEAARALSLSERQVRRYASQLEPTDKQQDSQRPHKGLPVAAPVELLAALAEANQRAAVAEARALRHW